MVYLGFILKYLQFNKLKIRLGILKSLEEQQLKQQVSDEFRITKTFYRIRPSNR